MAIVRINKTGINAARLLLEKYGVDSLSYFSLHEKKKFFFSSTGKSFLAYTVEGKVALVSGDPIGPPEDISPLLKEFHYFTKGAKYSSCFVGITQSMLPRLMQQGHKTLPIGNEAEILLPFFNKNLLKKKVRRAERYILRFGITCKIYKRSSIPAEYLNQLERVSEEWLKGKGKKEKGYCMTLGRFPQQLDADCEIVLALKNHNVLGYLTLVPVYASKSLSLDAMRIKRNTPNGLTEFLLMQAFEYFKNRNINTISLNFTTFYQQPQIRSKNLHALFVAVLFKGLCYLYKTHSLYRFNNKFFPQWRERYIAYEKRRFIPYYLYAIVKTEL